MNEVWFSSTEAVRGKCIHSWICDGNGAVTHVLSTDRTARAGEPSSAFQRDPSSWRPMTDNLQSNVSSHMSGIASPDEKSSSLLNDSHMAQRLELLIREAKEAFQSVLSRNSDLERELHGVRNRENEDFFVMQNGRRDIGSGSLPAVAPRLQIPVSRTLKDNYVFDISTPQTQRTSNRQQSLTGLNRRPTPLTRGRDSSF